MVSELMTERFSATDVEQALQAPDDASNGRLWPDVSQAAVNGDLEQLKKLHEDGADLRHQDDAGVSALMLAAKQVHPRAPGTFLSRYIAFYTQRTSMPSFAVNMVYLKVA